MYLRFDKETEKVLAAVREGYGGIFEDGADRRDHAYLIRLEANEALGIPEPKEIASGYDVIKVQIRYDVIKVRADDF